MDSWHSWRLEKEPTLESRAQCTSRTANFRKYSIDFKRPTDTKIRAGQMVALAVRHSLTRYAQGCEKVPWIRQYTPKKRPENLELARDRNQMPHSSNALCKPESVRHRMWQTSSSTETSNRTPDMPVILQQKECPWMSNVSMSIY